MLVNQMLLKVRSMKNRLTYTEMSKFESYTERLNYLRLHGVHHEAPRDISNKFYKSPAWLACRDKIIRRDLGQDLGVKRLFVDGPITVHHMNPLTKEDIENLTENCFDPDGLITVSDSTHKRIHYDQKEYQTWVERKPGDTKLW